jgi:hypothetical protein
MARCACNGCDQPADPGSRYHGDHYKRLVVARRKLRRLERYAASQTTFFDLELADILDLVHRRWPDTSWQLRRTTVDCGFVPENICVVDRKAKLPNGAQLLVVRAAAALQLRRPGPGLDVRDALEIFERQKGRCAVSGRTLRIIGRPTDGYALTSDRRSPPTNRWPSSPEPSPTTRRAGAVRHLLDLAAGIAAASPQPRARRS